MGNGRFAKISSVQEFSSTGTPVVLDAGAILFDTLNGKNLAQLRFKSTSDKVISKVQICISGYRENNEDSMSALPATIYYTYQNLAVRKGETFGEQVPVYFDSSEINTCSIKIVSVVFSDQTIWPSDNEESDGSPTLHTESTTISNNREVYPANSHKKGYRKIVATIVSITAVIVCIVMIFVMRSKNDTEVYRNEAQMISYGYTTFSNDKVYYIGDDETIYATDYDLNNKEKIIDLYDYDSDPDALESIYAFEDKLYYATTMGLYYSDLDGTNQTIIIESGDTINNFTMFGPTMQVEDRKLYFSVILSSEDNAGIYSYDLDSEDINLVTEFDEGVMWSFCVNGKDIFINCGYPESKVETRTIYHYDIDSQIMDKISVAEDGEYLDPIMYLYDDKIYYGIREEYGEGVDIYSMDLNGENITKIIDKESHSNIYHMAVYKNILYFFDSDHSCYKINIDGKDEKLVASGLSNDPLSISCYPKGIIYTDDHQDYHILDI